MSTLIGQLSHCLFLMSTSKNPSDTVRFGIKGKLKPFITQALSNSHAIYILPCIIGIKENPV